MSAALVTTLGNIWPIIMNLTDSSAIQHDVLEPYRFENHTGLPIKISIKQDQWYGAIVKEIKDQDFAILKLEDINKMNIHPVTRTKSLIYDKKTLSIQINSTEEAYTSRIFSHLIFRPVNNIGIDTPDTYFIYLEQVGEKFEKSPPTRKNTKKKTFPDDFL